jgi:hypothetical protein
MLPLLIPSSARAAKGLSIPNAATIKAAANDRLFILVSFRPLELNQ